jgi:hypothetical protein
MTHSSGLISSTIPSPNPSFPSHFNNQCNSNNNNKYSNIISDSYSTPLLVNNLGGRSQKGSSALFENGPVFKNTINFPVSYSSSDSATAEMINVETSVKHCSCEIGINTDISVTPTFNT